MAKRGKKPLDEETVPWNFKLPADLCYRVDLLMMNPITGKVKYGERKKLIIQLLRQWLRSQIGEAQQSSADSPTNPQGPDADDQHS